ncbi:MAG: FmdE family protein [Thermodesulfobacteriota bacterium]
MASEIPQEHIEKTIEFHGHWCPGLAIGIRVSEFVLREIGKASDEDIVAVVETDSCAVDAIQFLTGCTFGKGNLIHKDFGKNAFTFYRRRDGKAIRLVARPTSFRGINSSMVIKEPLDLIDQLRKKIQRGDLTEEERKLWEEYRLARCKQIMDGSFEELFEIKIPLDSPPKKARIYQSLTCESCGESVMETRTRRFDNQILCIPCFEVLEKRY